MKLKHYPLRLLHKAKLLQFLNLKTKAEFAEKMYIIPLAGNIGWNNIKYNTEPWMKHLIARLMKIKQGIFIDVGVNIGQTLMKLRSFSSVRYIGMEPNPECVPYLEKLIKANKLENCIICPVGLSNKNGLLTLFSNKAASPFASVIEGFRDHIEWNLTQTHVVPVMRGDDLLNDLGLNEGIAIVKIDVEGGELEVIEGFRETLQKERPFIVCEILPAKSLDDENGVFRKNRQDKLLKILKDLNYLVLRGPDTNEYEPVSQIKVGGDSSHYNYLLVPREFAHEFSTLRQKPV
jgi:FkbM family methyltransferase